MFPILFRIPLPHFPLRLWWAMAAVAAIALVYAALSFRRSERNTAIALVVGAAIAGFVGWKYRTVGYEAPNLPIYSYGVMLGVSLVVGWYLTLTLAEKEGLPKETMANCYVITALAAIAGSRILYILTNIEEFEDPTSHSFVFANIFALRKGGLVAYGGFVGGFLGSWAYLSSKKIRLLPWADAAVPSLATGLLITRIGCYLFGCDFGKKLPDGAPHWLKSLGTFPHWAQGTLDSGDGSPAYVRHMELFRGTPLEEELTRTNHSLPVHPTQLYESLVGLGLFALLMWQRKHMKFRGQMFFLFVFGYGFLRFLLEIIRDDVERGEYGPSLSEHVFIPVCFLLFAIAFVFGISLGIKNVRARMAARVVSFVPAVVAFVVLKPAAFDKTTNIQLSTSQWIGLLTALLASFFYAHYWQQAQRQPKMAMALGEGAAEAKGELGEEEEEEDEESETRTDTPAAKKRKKKKAKRPREVEVVAEEKAKEEEAKAAAEEEDEDDDDDEEAPAAAPQKTDEKKEEKDDEKVVPKVSPEPTT